MCMGEDGKCISKRALSFGKIACVHGEDSKCMHVNRIWLSSYRYRSWCNNYYGNGIKAQVDTAAYIKL